MIAPIKMRVSADAPVEDLLYAIVGTCNSKKWRDMERGTCMVSDVTAARKTSGVCELEIRFVAASAYTKLVGGEEYQVHQLSDFASQLRKLKQYKV